MVPVARCDDVMEGVNVGTDRTGAAVGLDSRLQTRDALCSTRLVAIQHPPEKPERCHLSLRLLTASFAKRQCPVYSQKASQRLLRAHIESGEEAGCSSD